MCDPQGSQPTSLVIQLLGGYSWAVKLGGACCPELGPLRDPWPYDCLVLFCGSPKNSHSPLLAPLRKKVIELTLLPFLVFPPYFN